MNAGQTIVSALFCMTPANPADWFFLARTALKTRVPLLFVLKIKTVVFRAFCVFRAKK
jgi:hypothetical protein